MVCTTVQWGTYINNMQFAIRFRVSDLIYILLAGLKHPLVAAPSTIFTSMPVITIYTNIICHVIMSKHGAEFFTRVY